MYKLLIFFILLIILFYDIKFKEINIDKKTISVRIIENNQEYIYELPRGSKIYDLSKLSEIDLSEYPLNTILHDEDIILKNDNKNDLISINSASIDELCRLPGIKEALAKKIIEYRNTNGLFNNIEELMNINGIKEAKFSLIKDKICP